MPMSKSKLYAWLLSILGFQMQGCHNGDYYEEIEDVEYKGKNIQNVVFGKVLEVKNHPESDHLHILNIEFISQP